MSVNVTATPEPGNVPGRIRLDVTATAGETSASVMRLDADGALRPVRTTDGNPLALSGGVGLLYDHELPYGTLVSYSTTATPSAQSAQVAISPDKAWLIHPGVPSLSQQITISEVDDRSRAVSRGLHDVQGRRYPVPITDGQRKAAEYRLSIFTRTDAERRAIDALIDDAGVLLLNVPTGNAWGLGAEYVSIGTSVEKRVGRLLAEPGRVWDYPCAVVDQPIGGSQAQRTLADLLAFPTLAAIQNAYPTLTAVQAGP